MSCIEALSEEQVRRLLTDRNRCEVAVKCSGGGRVVFVYCAKLLFHIYVSREE